MPANISETGLFLIHSLAEAGSTSEEAWRKGEFLASNRIQLGPARLAAKSLGITVGIANLRSERTDTLLKLGNPRFCLIGKLSHPDQDFAMRMMVANLAAVSILQQQGSQVVVAYSDNLASTDNTPTATLYRSLLWQANGVIYATEAMRELGRQWYRRSNQPREWIIEDPWQIERQAYSSLEEGMACRLIWFGHETNSRYLLELLPNLLTTCERWPSFELTVLGASSTAEKAERVIRSVSARRPWTLRFIEWNSGAQPSQLTSELRRAHISILPSDPNDPRKLAASHNRAVDSIQGGCMTIASPIKSYQEISRLALISEDIAKTINMAIPQHGRLIEKWSGLREKHLFRFSPNANINKWRDVIRYYSDR